MAELDTSKLFEILRLKEQEQLGSRAIADIVGCGKSTVNRFLAREGYIEFWEEYDKKPLVSGDMFTPQTRTSKLKGKRFVFTLAQNNTYVHSKFLESLEVFMEHNNAELIVGTCSYNKNGFRQIDDEELYDSKIKHLIQNKPLEVAHGLIFCGELNISPTAVNPISGLHGYTREDSGILPHTKVQIESLPTHKTEPCRMVYTTGAITQRNYVQRKTGQKAEFHHIVGALYVEVDNDGQWFARHLIADEKTGSFQDLDCHYSPEGVETNVRVEAINYGDIHTEKLDLGVAEASFSKNPESMLETLRPKYQFMHDLSDFTPRNHHNLKDPHFMFAQHVNGAESVEDALRLSADLLSDISRPWCKTVVVNSNHDNALLRWLKESSFKSDPVNAVFYLKSQLAVYEAIANGNDDFCVFEYTLRNLSSHMPNTKFLREDESYIICSNIECGNHGHLGLNGSRGNPSGFQRVGSKVNLGHGHAASVKDGVYVAGVTGKLAMDYNSGYSSWSHAHIVTYPTGKRAIVTIKNGKWRA